MGIDAKDVLAMLPTAIDVAKGLAGLVSPRAAEAVGFGGDIATFIIDAEERGLSAEAIAEGVSDLSVMLVKRLKFGA
jgi:hypothetical protein